MKNDEESTDLIGIGVLSITDDSPSDQRDEGQENDEWDEVAGDSVGELLDWSLKTRSKPQAVSAHLAGLCLLNKPDDLRQR